MKIDYEAKCDWCHKNKSNYEYMWGDLGNFKVCMKCAKNMTTNLVNDLMKE